MGKLQAKLWNQRKMTRAYHKWCMQGVPRRIRRASQAQYARAMRQAEASSPRSRLAAALLRDWMQAEVELAEERAGWSRPPRGMP
jgi:hypothetical protein